MPTALTSQPKSKRRALTTAALIAPLAALLGVSGVALGGAAQASGNVDIFPDSLKPKTASVTSTNPVNLGLKFSSDQSGKVVALQFYRSALQKKAYQATIWDNGVAAKRVTFPASSKAGWQTVTLPSAFSVNKGRVYTVSYLATDGHYAKSSGALSKPVTRNGLRAIRSVYANASSAKLPTTADKTSSSYLLDVVFSKAGTAAAKPAAAKTTAKPAAATTTAKPAAATTTAKPAAATTTAKPAAATTTAKPAAATTTAKPAAAKTTAKPAAATTSGSSAASGAPSGSWPNANNTGVPAGTTLTAYTGPMTITSANTVIRNKIVTGTLTIRAANVQIINSRINGTVDLRDPKTTNYSFSIVDSEVHIGDNLNTGLMRGNFHANRVEVTGGRRSMYCAYNCVIENSWVHAQGGDPGGQSHFSGIRMEQKGTIRHNTITCEAQRGSGTGCSAGLTGYGDFAPVQDNLIENNYFYGGGGGRSTVCAYGGSSGDDGKKPYGNQARDIRFINNVFVKGSNGLCGNVGTVISFDASRPGNVWSGNTWLDGSAVRPN